jgi:AraC-like DNA-binding protein/CheY-like chemotaxis protein
MSNTIVVVEDESLIAFDIKLILEKEGYDTIINITSVEMAIECIEKHQPILVLIDINLNKDKDGIDLGSYMLQKDTIPYIYITSYSNKTTLDKVNDTRPHGYIVKPFKPSDLLSTISVVLNNYKHRNIDTFRVEILEDEVIPFRIKEVINYINKNIEKKIDVDELIVLTKWTKRHFSRIFFKYLHVTPYQYILSRKVKKAESMLKDTEIPINQISFDLGFQSHSNFCIAFKKINGSTPENYRNRLHE